jgi:hypothetical protein
MKFNHCAQRTRLLEWDLDSSDSRRGIATLRQSFTFQRQRLAENEQVSELQPRLLEAKRSYCL